MSLQMCSHQFWRVAIRKEEAEGFAGAEFEAVTIDANVSGTVKMEARDDAFQAVHVFN
jgi:hypothetical protein